MVSNDASAVPGHSICYQLIEMDYDNDTCTCLYLNHEKSKVIIALNDVINQYKDFRCVLVNSDRVDIFYDRVEQGWVYNSKKKDLSKTIFITKYVYPSKG